LCSTLEERDVPDNTYPEETLTRAAMRMQIGRVFIIVGGIEGLARETGLAQKAIFPGNIGRSTDLIREFDGFRRTFDTNSFGLVFVL
jgi:hypothetical protein